jgi:hypothetical protein
VVGATDPHDSSLDFLDRTKATEFFFSRASLHFVEEKQCISPSWKPNPPTPINGLQFVFVTIMTELRLDAGQGQNDVSSQRQPQLRTGHPSHAAVADFKL